MSLDDCFIPSSPPRRQRAPSLEVRGRCGSHPCLSQLDLLDLAAAARALRCGDSPVRRRNLQVLNRTVAVPPRRVPAIPGPLPKVLPGAQLPPSLDKENLGGAGSPRHSAASALKELKDVLPEEPKQYHPSQASVTRSAPSYRLPRSKANWVSKERSTPEGYSKEQHAWRFEFSFPPQLRTSSIAPTSQVVNGAPVTRLPKKVKTPEERTALREKRIAQRKKFSRIHCVTALRKYNRANNTKFVLVEVTSRVLFFEFGEGCYHYNFKAKPKDHQYSDGSTKLFFAEVDYCPRNEDAILLCCIVGENDSGQCHGCEGQQPKVIHPSSNAYGGGSSTCIEMPWPDSASSDSD